MAAIILYQYPGGDGLGSVSPPCLKIELAMKLIGCEYELQNLRSTRGVSLTGRLPVLEIDGERYHESMRIVDELEARFDAPWTHAPEAERVNDRVWDAYFNDRLYWCGFYLRWAEPEGNRLFMNALLGRAGAFTRWMVKRAFVPRQRKRTILHGAGLLPKSQILTEIQHALDGTLAAVGDGPFLQGRAAPGRGDLSAASLISQAGFRDSMPEVMEMVGRRPALVAYLKRVFEACGCDVPRWLGES